MMVVTLPGKLVCLTVQDLIVEFGEENNIGELWSKIKICQCWPEVVGQRLIVVQDHLFCRVTSKIIKRARLILA